MKTLKQLRAEKRTELSAKQNIPVWEVQIDDDQHNEIIKSWLQERLDELNKDDKRIYDTRTDYKAFQLEELIEALELDH